MKKFNLVIKIPMEFYDSDNELDNKQDVEELYNTHKHILLDLIENLIINNNEEYKVMIEKIQKEET